ncbi:MAG: rhomboid family intramembrane serine protease, partial [Tannerellaceae bacterium]|nr:rhomboid family intramembrane serine protease [Tannerellaceae bacterium]
MDDFISKLKYNFKQGNILSKLIYINVGLFLIIRLFALICTLFSIDGGGLLLFLQVPSSPELLLYRPWTLITYMFTHFDFLHILFNMLWLYWFGGLFLTFFSERQLGGLYLIGGIAGALLYIVSYNLFPYFSEAAAYSTLMGASASVMAIV